MATTVHIADWYALELAFSFNGAEHRAYLDLQTGAVPILDRDEVSDQQSLRDIAAKPDRFLPIHPVSPREQHHWMVKFAAALQDATLRARLDSALSGPGAFRRFKEVLRVNSGEWRRWRRVRAVHVRERILAWLADKALALDAPPPWQANDGSERPERDEEHDRLRRVALDRIGELSPAALELAVVYLRHVHRRHGMD
jgi:hypothetical protein